MKHEPSPHPPTGPRWSVKSGQVWDNWYNRPAGGQLLGRVHRQKTPAASVPRMPQEDLTIRARLHLARRTLRKWEESRPIEDRLAEHEAYLEKLGV